MTPITERISVSQRTTELRNRHENDPSVLSRRVDADSARDDESSDGSPATPRGEGHIGRVVAGSLTFGVAAAVMFVARPFASAREHGITGSALLAFALGWAMLAVLSELDEPWSWRS